MRGLNMSSDTGRPSGEGLCLEPAMGVKLSSNLILKAHLER